MGLETRAIQMIDNVKQRFLSTTTTKISGNEKGADTLISQQQICPVCTRIFANKQGNLAQIALFKTPFTPNAWGH